MRSNISSTATDNPVSAAQAGSWTVRANLSSTSSDNPVNAAQVGSWTVIDRPSDTNWASSAGFHFNSSGELLAVVSPGNSTIVTVAQVNGNVTVRPSDTNWASSAGFHFNSSGELQIAGTFSATTSTIVSVAAQSQSFGARTVMTMTSSGLTNGAARESNAVDNTGTKYRDFGVFVTRKGTTGSSAFTDFYVYTSLGDTTYTDGATGSDASFTAANRRHSRYLGSLQMSTTPSNVWGYWKLSDIFVTMPSKWGLIEINNSAGTHSSTNTDIVTAYEGVY